MSFSTSTCVATGAGSEPPGPFACGYRLAVDRGEAHQHWEGVSPKRNWRRPARCSLPPEPFPKRATLDRLTQRRCRSLQTVTDLG
jgi:hypothetical protein